MALYADLVLPSTTFMEEWGYDHSPPGAGFAEVKIKQPVVKPRGEARAVGDILFELARRLQGGVAQSFAGIGDDSKGFVKLRTSSLMAVGGVQQERGLAGTGLRIPEIQTDLQHARRRNLNSTRGTLKRSHLKMGKKPEDDKTYLPHLKEANLSRRRKTNILSFCFPINR